MSSPIRVFTPGVLVHIGVFGGVGLTGVGFGRLPFFQLPEGLAESHGDELGLSL